MPDTLHRALRWWAARAGVLQALWQGFSIGVIGFNSYLMLLSRCAANRGLKHVVCAGITAYAAVFLFQAVRLRRAPARLRRVAGQTRVVFRLVYTALSLTAILLDVLALLRRPGPVDPLRLALYGWNFGFMTLWGTFCLWGPPALARVRGLLARRGIPLPAAE